jgi:hypothetical protein
MGKIPAAIAEAAGGAFCPAGVIAAHDQHENVPTYAANRILERRNRLHQAAEAALASVPKIGTAVPDLGQRNAYGLERGYFVRLVGTR